MSASSAVYSPGSSFKTGLSAMPSSFLYASLAASNWSSGSASMASFALMPPLPSGMTASFAASSPASSLTTSVKVPFSGFQPSALMETPTGRGSFASFSTSVSDASFFSAFCSCAAGWLWPVSHAYQHPIPSPATITAATTPTAAFFLALHLRLPSAGGASVQSAPPLPASTCCSASAAFSSWMFSVFSPSVLSGVRLSSIFCDPFLHRTLP